MAGCSVVNPAAWWLRRLVTLASRRSRLPIKRQRFPHKQGQRDWNHRELESMSLNQRRKGGEDKLGDVTAETQRYWVEHEANAEKMSGRDIKREGEETLMDPRRKGLELMIEHFSMKSHRVERLHILTND
ncbi:Hypothetical predicted protein [Xyrichtys novacula]|uniref:Uncharacterized protein n=1 Tax=Xyrichtys novacula TaxID=13765 RepID=A0AAV1FPQ3_XYRNO|nr:Hypothetical predicted protein [Xyrichtys novacula]